jgi:cytochrome c biogenesis protein
MVILIEGVPWTDPEGQIPFGLELADFRMDFYEGQDAVQSYVSEVSVYEDNERVRSERLEVNHPLHYRGVGLYQSDWGLRGVRLRAVPPEGEPEEVLIGLVEDASFTGSKWFVVDPEARGDLLSNGWAVVAHDFHPDAELTGPGGSPRPRSMWPRSPALQLLLAETPHGEEPGIVGLGWLAPDHPLEHKGWRFEWGDLIHWSGLQARRDPGVPFVWAGFIAATLALCVVFYLPPRTLRVRITPLADGASHVLFGASTRALADPAADIERVCDRLSPPEKTSCASPPGRARATRG